MKILTILGARPQFVKASAVSRSIKNHAGISEVIVHTGQHFDHNMSHIFFEELKISKPDYHLDINNLNHGAMTGRMMEKLEDIVLKELPDWVLVYGDTNSTLAGALVASKLHVNIAHVEAGLRSYNMQMPEEINRILTDRISRALFCPTQTAVDNLLREGYGNIDADIQLVGDVMYDSLLYYQNYARRPDFDVPEKFALCTLHRADNTDSKENLKSIFQALNEISKQVPLVLPLHPRTRSKLDLSLVGPNIQLVNPVGYLEMLYLLKHSELVLTDSGGLQKEAYLSKKACITLRTETEWVELVEHGVNRIVGTDPQAILEAFSFFSDSTDLDFDTGLYGNGAASDRIVEQLLKTQQ